MYIKVCECIRRLLCMFMCMRAFICMCWYACYLSNTLKHIILLINMLQKI